MAEAVNDDARYQGTVENRATQPKGLLPKNTQALVIAGISLVMVGAIALSGTGGSKTPPRQPVAPSLAVMDPNQARILEYRQRLDEQARKLQAEQAQVTQAKQQLAATTGAENPNVPYPAGGYSQEA